MSEDWSSCSASKLEGRLTLTSASSSPTRRHMALGLAYILINALSMLKRNGGGGIWLFRVVRRGADRFALFNARLTGPIGTVAWVSVQGFLLERGPASHDTFVYCKG